MLRDLMVEEVAVSSRVLQLGTQGTQLVCSQICAAGLDCMGQKLHCGSVFRRDGNDELSDTGLGVVQKDLHQFLDVFLGLDSHFEQALAKVCLRAGPRPPPQ